MNQNLEKIAIAIVVLLILLFFEIPLDRATIIVDLLKSYALPASFIVIALIFRKQLTYVIEKLFHEIIKRGGDIEVGNIFKVRLPRALVTEPVDPPKVPERVPISPEAQKIRFLLLNSNEAHNAGNYQTALDNLREALKLDQRNPVLHHNLASRILNYVVAGFSSKDLLPEAESSAQLALYFAGNLQQFPGTLYNLARAQALMNKRDSLRITFEAFKAISMPRSLFSAIKIEKDFLKIQDMPEYQELVKYYEYQEGWG